MMSAELTSLGEGPRSLDNPHTKFDREAQARFLEKYAETGRHVESAQFAGVSYQTMRIWRKTDPDFGAAFETADRAYKEKLRREIERRGMLGWEEPLYQGGVRVLEPVLDENGHALRDENGHHVMRPASVRKFSDRLLEILAKRQDHEFRERVDLQGKVEATSTDASTPSSTELRSFFESISAEGREKLRAVLEEFAGKQARPALPSTVDAPPPTPEDSRVGVVDVEPV